jgi:hypothetical protein
VAVYDERAPAGLPLHVTEFWAEGQTGDMQAEYVANYLTTAFGHPAIEAFFLWGFMSAAIQWRDQFSSHDLNPVFERVRDLIHHEWKTHERLVTDRDGVVRFRAFYGDYAVRHASRGVTFRVDRQAALPLTIVA